MRRILIIGSGGVPGVLRQVLGPQITISMLCEPVVTDFGLGPYVTQQINDDCFYGGGRSKGEKKRAARERRLRGGY
jgi:hypothetical protein